MNVFVTGLLADVHQQLKPFYSDTLARRPLALSPPWHSMTTPAFSTRGRGAFLPRLKV